MNLNYNKWRARSLFESLEQDTFECVHCGVEVKHPIYHYIKFHKYVRQLPILRLKKWVRNIYVTLYNKWFDSISRMKVNKFRNSINDVLNENIKKLTAKSRKETEWQELLRIEREALVCMALEREVCGYE